MFYAELKMQSPYLQISTTKKYYEINVLNVVLKNTIFIAALLNRNVNHNNSLA